MKKLLPLAIAFGLMMPLAQAQKPAEPAKEKPAATETKKPKETTTDKKKEKDAKPAAPSAADKALTADAKKIADTLTAAERKKVLDLLNKGEAKDIEAVEGIGEVKAGSIVAKRPYAKVEDVVMVDGIGIETYKNILATVNPAVKTEKPKAGEKKTKEKTTKPETKPATKEKEKAADPKKPA